MICLTDYKVFSAGRFALYDLIKLGAVIIGEEIRTPMNCFGNCKNIEISNRKFAISTKYFNLFENISIDLKNDFDYSIFKDLEPKNFVPDIIVRQNINDYLNHKDTTLEYAFNYIC